jgi:3-isopropylmalate/(R)-2-methylmalate dehydratase small subunit
MGLPIFELQESAEIAEGDEISVDMNNGTVTNKTSQKVYKFIPIPAFMQELIDAGGLMNYAQKEIKGK